ERTLGQFDDPQVALVQTPQHYANTRDNDVAAAAWAQQALFFGAIARGKDARRSMFCCGTNMVFRRYLLEALGRLPEVELWQGLGPPLPLHENGWRSVYVPGVRALRLGQGDVTT